MSTIRGPLVRTRNGDMYDALEVADQLDCCGDRANMAEGEAFHDYADVVRGLVAMIADRAEAYRPNFEWKRSNAIFFLGREEAPRRMTMAAGPFPTREAAVLYVRETISAPKDGWVVIETEYGHEPKAICELPACGKSPSIECDYADGERTPQCLLPKGHADPCWWKREGS